ncbi:MAG: nif-specific transcriptional activator NifA [Desulfovibrionaceae bacterium]
MPKEISGLQLKVLSAICQVIDKALDLESALRTVLRILSEELSMKRATITLYDPGTGSLVISASHGLSPEERQRGVYRLGEGVTGCIFQTAEPYYVPDISKEPLFLDKTQARIIEKGRVSFLGVPILSNSHAVGVLNVDRLFEDDVSWREDISFLTVVATLIGQFMSLNQKVKDREERLRRENVSLRSQISKEQRGPYIVGRSLAMQDVERQMGRVAPTRATVLLLGESGVGKTLIAKIIHGVSDRKDNPFVKVNCASIPENLLESELFGYEKGAFTGASGAKPGRFEDAHNGTIFLDEIGELSLSLQAKLLRVIQDREFERLGSNRTVRVDVRIVAATNKDLGAMAELGEFRSDLYYRLSVFPIRVPPLRERMEDISGLLNHFLDRMEREYGRRLFLSPQALECLCRYDWPGNVREMENLIERLVIMADDERIDASALTRYLAPTAERTEHTAVGKNPRSVMPSPGSTLLETERQEILSALRRNGWVQYRAAYELGLTARQMGYRVRKFGLEEMVAGERARARNRS